MLAPWQEASTWNSLVNGVQADGVEAVSSADAVTGSVTDGVTTIDVTSSIEAWLNGAANYGWAFLSLGSDGWRFSSSEGGTPPRLDVVYTIESGAPANTPPVAHDDNVTLNEDTTLAVAVLGNDTDANGDTLYVTGIDTGPAHGAAAVNADGTIQYTPDANFFGADSFTYTISDGQGGAASAIVGVTVNPINDLPLAADDVANSGTNQSVTVGVLLNDSDPDGDALTVLGITTGPAHGTAVVNTDNTITYTPASNYSGQDSFVYQIGDGHGGTAVASVNLNIADQAISASYVATALSTNDNRILEHDNNSKAFYFNGTWWAVLPDGSNWSVHEFTGAVPDVGSLGGWTTNSSALFGTDSHADVVFDETTNSLYVLQFGSSSAGTHVLKLGFDQNAQSWSVDVDAPLSGAGAMLSSDVWSNNSEMGIGLDQQGHVIVSAISGSSSGSAGLHVAFGSSNLGSWGSAVLDATTTSDGGSNGNSKADFVTFNENGIDKIGIIYSRDGGGSNVDWSFAWHNTQSTLSDYSSGWQKEVVANVNIDNHVSAVSDGEFIYAVLKDDQNSIWLLKGNPGDWDAAYLVVDGSVEDPSRPNSGTRRHARSTLHLLSGADLGRNR